MWFINLLLALVIALAPTQSPEQSEAAFDYNTVRADMFAGFGGDAARLTKAMEACERTLARQPKHPEALVWHGSGLFFQAGQAFQRGDMANGGQLWERGLAEMNDAASLAPDNLGVIIPRGAVLLQATRQTPPAMGWPLLELAVRDYEHVLDLQKSYFHTLGDHPKGELLFGLAEGYARLGDQAKARLYFERLVADAPGSGQTPRARAWLETGVVPEAAGLGCVGCHK
jgi:tetratricopeptide (TPR) repeat protein